MELFKIFETLKPTDFQTCWRSPSNIAFVKYWGKKALQIPANPSFSMTLKDCYSKTRVQFCEHQELNVELTLEGVTHESFGLKIYTYLNSLTSFFPWLSSVGVKVETSNTFPHGTGIASSASGLSALALCLTDYLYFLRDIPHDELFFVRASFLARLASGSACRSVYGGYSTWGEDQNIEGGTDLYAQTFNVHPELYHLMDTVVVISEKEKTVSSRDGHQRMKEHAFSDTRFIQAKDHFRAMVNAMRSGEFEEMGLILENEALSLHAMMMTSPEAYTLLKPNSLATMDLVRDFRRQTGHPIYFTLDAGPNVHLIYPDALKNKIHPFITHELTPLAVNIINDCVGEGPVKC